MGATGMTDIADGQIVEVKGSAAKPYLLRNVGGVYSCTCPAWRNQSTAIERRTCKHLKKYRGEAAENDRLGSPFRIAEAAAEGGDAGEAAAGPPLLLAQSWTTDVDLAGWWMSEKLDGVRAYWDGSRLVSRLGNVLHAPDWFLAPLPKTPLDGELWLERKAFQRTVAVVRRQDKSDHWKQISYVVFDAPAQTSPFEERIAFLKETISREGAPHLRLLAQQPCRDVEHLRQELARVEALGGEGLMLREPGSRYEAGRSSTLLKVKTFHDAEARVIEHQAGRGRHQGRLGALVVELADGTRFSVGTGFSDAQRARPPAVGSTIAFRYQELSDGGVPRFPSFVGMRSEAVPTSIPADAADPSPAARKRSASPAAPKASPASKPAAAATASSGTQAAAAPTAGPRYFECVEDGASKFWEVVVSGSDATVRYGRIGAAGQSKTKSFPDAAAAQAYADDLVAEKTAKGYKAGTPGGE